MSPHHIDSKGFYPVNVPARIQDTSFGQQFTRDLPTATSNAR